MPTAKTALEKIFAEQLEQELPANTLSAAKIKALAKKLSAHVVAAAPEKTASGTTTPAATPLLEEIGRQINEIEATTEEAANTIMELAEKQLDLLPQARRLLEMARTPKSKNSALIRMRETCTALHSDLMAIITAASFHDLAVQRAHKINASISDLKELALGKEPVATKKTNSGSELKGPVLDANQDSIDALFDQLNG